MKNAQELFKVLSDINALGYDLSKIGLNFKMYFYNQNTQQDEEKQSSKIECLAIINRRRTLRAMEL